MFCVSVLAMCFVASGALNLKFEFVPFQKCFYQRDPFADCLMLGVRGVWCLTATFFDFIHVFSWCFK